MYYWLKENLEEEGYYVISDDSDDVYIVGDGRPYKLKPKKHMLLKFKPYLEKIKTTETCPELENI